MDKPFFPKKPWGWLAVVALMAPLFAVFQPARSYSGPAPKAMALTLTARHDAIHVWPRTQADFSFGPNDRPGRRYAYALERVEGDAAIYRIVVNERPQLWRLRPAEKPQQIDSR